MTERFQLSFLRIPLLNNVQGQIGLWFPTREKRPTSPLILVLRGNNNVKGKFDFSPIGVCQLGKNDQLNPCNIGTKRE
jgi:hypothetical protein